MRIYTFGATALCAVACLTAPACHGHEHGHDEGEHGHAGGGHDEAHGHGEHGHGHGAGAIAVTHWTDETELFVEFLPLVVGQESPFAAHLTRLSDFAALSEGTVVVTLSGGGPDETFQVEGAASPGIFRPIAKPTAAGKRRVTLSYQGEGLDVVHEMGEFEVYAQASDVPAEQEEGDDGTISFLKEQQWKIPFGTAPVVQAELRASVEGYGTVRPRGDGHIEISATVAGRLASSGDGFPAVGQRVEASQTLAWIAPRSAQSSDPASLDLAVTRARLALEAATRDRTRLEGLLSSGAVAEKRALDAKRSEAAARAELQAAERRLSQHHGQQSSRVAGSIAVRAGLTGTVIAVHAAPGSFIEEGAPLFEIADLDRLWLVVAVPAIHAAAVTAPKGVWFEVEGIDEPMSLGPEALVATAGALDETTRTLRVTYTIPNPEGTLRPGMYARAHVVTGGGTTGPAIPVSAIVDDGGTDVVYVQPSGESFERRVVRLGVRDRDLVEVISGVALGERVVSRGALTVKLASMSTELPAHGHAH